MAREFTLIVPVAFEDARMVSELWGELQLRWRGGRMRQQAKNEGPGIRAPLTSDL
jgi:hypothetical protein